MTALRRDERGQSLSVFVLVVVFALLLVAGLVVDGGAQSDAARRAEQAASAAARAAVDAGAPARAGGRGVDPAAMSAAARQALTDRGIEGTVVVAGGRVRVETSVTTRTVFLSLIGVTRLAASGAAEADVRTP